MNKSQIWCFWFKSSSVCTKELGRELEQQVSTELSVKHCRGSVVDWGCISAKGVGDFVKVQEVTNVKK